METVPLINRLLASNKFKLKVATKDWHPESHISFAPNHPAPNNKPFESFIKMSNHVANKPDEKMQQRLWPVHCVQNTKGAELLPELDTDKVDIVIEKGSDERVEMYSAFSDCFGNLTAGKGGVNHDLAQILRDKGITETYCVGIAGEYCVRFTAADSAKAGFKTYVIEEGQKCSNPGAWPDVKKSLEAGGVVMVSQESAEVQRLFN